MLSGFPVYVYFKNGNAFFGAEGGMRYRLAEQAAEDGRVLAATVWPGPWSAEHTAEEKYLCQTFPADQAGLDAAAGWLAQQYAAGRETWDNIPSILDCEPDR